MNCSALVHSYTLLRHTTREGCSHRPGCTRADTPFNLFFVATGESTAASHLLSASTAHASIGESTAISPPASYPATRRVGRLFASSGLACGTGSRFAVDTTPHCLSVLPRVSRASRRTPHASPSLTHYQLLGCCCQPREHATSHFSLRLGTYLSCLTCPHSYSPRL